MLLSVHEKVHISPQKSAFLSTPFGEYEVESSNLSAALDLIPAPITVDTDWIAMEGHAVVGIPACYKAQKLNLHRNKRVEIFGKVDHLLLGGG